MPNSPSKHHAARLAHAVWDDELEPLAHDECIAALPTLVDLEAAGRDIPARYDGVRQHLDHCVDCSEQYAELLDLALATAANELPLPEMLPAPDLSFLYAPRVSLQEAVTQWAEQALARIAPAYRDRLQIIADIFFEQVEFLTKPFVLPGLEPNRAYRGDEPGPAFSVLALAYTTTNNLIERVSLAQWDAWLNEGAHQLQLEQAALSAADEIGLDPTIGSHYARELAAQLAADPTTLRALLQQQSAI